MKKELKEIKVRYSPQEFENIKEKAKKLGKSPNQYQIETTKKAKVIIEVKDE